MANNIFELLDEIRNITTHAVRNRTQDDAIIVKQIHELIETYELDRLREQTIASHNAIASYYGGNNPND